MMQVTCQWCGHRYTMKREDVAEAVAKAEAEKASHHVEHCPKCRKVLKLQVSQLKRSLPPTPAAPAA